MSKKVLFSVPFLLLLISISIILAQKQTVHAQSKIIAAISPQPVISSSTVNTPTPILTLGIGGSPSPKPSLSAASPTPITTIDINPTGTSVCSTFAKGDTNCDGAVDLLDYFYYVRAVASATLPTGVSADVNGDKVIDTKDRDIIISGILAAGGP